MTTRMLLVVAIGLLPGVAVAQGLGGAAQKEAQRRERQRTAGDDARVYSNTDLSSEPDDAGGSAPAVAGSESGGGDAAPEASDPAPPEAVDRDDALRERLDRAAARRKRLEQQWRARAAAARATVEAARTEHDAVCKTGGFYVSGG